MVDLWYETCLDRINGLKWILNGVDGVLSVERINGMTEIIHNPSARGRRSARYRSTRRLMGDDYTTTLTHCEDTLGDIFAHVASLAPIDVKSRYAGNVVV